MIALIVVASAVIAAFAVVPLRRALERRRVAGCRCPRCSPFTEQEINEAIAPFSDRPDGLREPS